jgi:hypothetical protein
MDDDPFRHLWEDDPPRASSGRPAVGNDAQLVPLARAQDAVCPVEGGGHGRRAGGDRPRQFAFI